MSYFKQSIQSLVQPAFKKNTTAQNPVKAVRKLIVFRNYSAYKQCLHHCKSLGIQPLRTITSLHAVLLQVHPGADIQRFESQSMVRRVESDFRLKLHVLQQKGAAIKFTCASVGKPEIIPWGISRVQAPQVWPRTKGKFVRIAVLDTGIAGHPDLRLSGSVNILRTEQATDLNGHGTHVAGTITALQNRFGVVGVAPQIKLYAVKAFDRNGSAYVSDIIRGIDWCIRNRMQVINMSFGVNKYNASLREMIRKAYRNGICMIVSCGNNGSKGGQIDYPARFSETIAVAATTINNKITDFSSRGVGISVSAPGLNVCSTYLQKSYEMLSGTSMSAPHVTGAVALLLSRSPGLSPAKVKQRLQNTALSLKGFNIKDQGSGLVQLAKAVPVSKQIS